jgi:hypothetical protein
LRQWESELQRRGIDVVVVTFEEPWRAAAYVEQSRLPWPLLLDEERKLFHAYGMGRGRTLDVMGWDACIMSLGLLLRGRRLRWPTGDVFQLGGDVLIDPDGRVRLHHVGRGPADRPAISDIVEAAHVER